MPRLQVAVIFLLCLTGQFSLANVGESPKSMFWGPQNCGINTVGQQWHDDLDTPVKICTDANFTNVQALTRSTTASTFTGTNGRAYVQTTFSWTGLDKSGVNRTFSVLQQQCQDIRDAFVLTGNTSLSFSCQDTTTEIKNEDIATFSGYLIGSFFIGYAFGYAFRVFYKIADHV